MFYLYRITLQKYSYIGVSKSPVRRWGQHSRAATTLGRAIRQCGRDNVIFQIIATGDRETIYALERAEIFAQKTRFPGGYNIAEGGFGGREPLPSTREKLSAAMVGTTLSAANRAKLLAANIGKHHSAETRAKISVAARHRAPLRPGRMSIRKKYATIASGER
jgi:hypothetical protein